MVLAAALRAAGVSTLTGAAARAAVLKAFATYEAARAKRCLPLTVRSYGMGVLLQAGALPVVAARDAFVAGPFNPGHFLDHATFDCGSL